MRNPFGLMSTVFFLILSLFFFLPPSAMNPSASPGDSLWQKAVETAGRSEKVGLYPSKVRVLNIMYKSGNRLVSTDEIIYEIKFDASGEQSMEIVKAIHDGKDFTEKARKEAEKARKEAEKQKKNKDKDKDKDKEEKTVNVSLNMHPFSPSSQETVTVKRVRSETLDGKKTAVYNFSWKISEKAGSISGTAWLDEDTGFPLKVASTPNPLPDHVSKMKTTVFFKADKDGRWISDHSLIEAHGSFLFISRDVVTRVTFLKYKTREKQATAASGKS